MSIGATKVYDNKQIITTLDHDVQNKSEANLKKYENIKQFSQLHGITHFEAGSGIGHQIMVENGFAWPGTLAGNTSRKLVFWSSLMANDASSCLRQPFQHVRRRLLPGYSRGPYRCCQHVGVSRDRVAHVGLY